MNRSERGSKHQHISENPVRNLRTAIALIVEIEPDPTGALDMNEQTIFNEALELTDPQKRGAFLDEACHGDPALRQRIDRLLARHEHAGDFLEASPVRAATTIDEPGAVSTGVTIGPYKLVEQIGEGGMGAVWMVQQTVPVKRVVALKLIKAGMDSKQVIARFEAERQALALMDHPNIAKVLDAGATDSGRPYFVMDLVKGVPITRYCDEHHLTPKQRLELFLPVCQAVQHAHQKGIIHRDIKPSNVLVALYDGKPVPKIIDFGVAKAAGQSLTDKTLVTGFGAIVGTLEYMSPEQAEINQLDIDTRSDIYSLGVLLYELLTGSTPFTRKELERAGMLEMLRVIREQEPSKPSTKLSTAEGLPTLAANRGTEPAKLTKLVRGELDWIVMKALEKDRSRRYETANGFAMDVQRYLADEPVLACPPTARYRLWKFVRRNQGRVAGAAVFLALLVVGTVISTLFGISASQNAVGERRARKDADTQTAIAKKAALEASQNASTAKAEAERARGLLHAANMGRTQDALRARRVARTRELLDEMHPAPGATDLRGFEWHYLRNQLHAGRDVVEVHPAAAAAVNWFVDRPTLSPDGRWAASTRMVPGTTAAPRPGTEPISQTAMYELRVWDTATGQVIFMRERTQPINWHDVALCPSAGLVAWGSVRSVTVYDVVANVEKTVVALDHRLANRQERANATALPVLLFDPAGTRLAAITLVEVPAPGRPMPRLIPGVEVWEVTTRRRLMEIAPADGWVPWFVGFSQNGTRVAVRSNRDNVPQALPGKPPGVLSRLTVWNVGDAKPQFELPDSDAGMTSYPFTPDGHWLALAQGRAVALYDATTGQPGRVHAPTEQPVMTYAFAQDGKAMAVGESSGTITVIAESGDVLDVLYGHEAPLNALAFRPDGRLISHGRDGKIKEWAPGRHRTPIPAAAPSYFVGVDRAQRYALTVRHNQTSLPRGEHGPVRPEYTVWDAPAGIATMSRTLGVPGIDSAEVYFRTGSLSPDGRRVLMSSSLGVTPMRRYGVGALILPGPFDGLAGLTRLWSIAGRAPPILRTEVVDVATGRERIVLPAVITSAGWSANGRYVCFHMENDKDSPGRVLFEKAVVWDLDADPPRRVALEPPPAAALLGWQPDREWFSADSRFLTILGAVPRNPQRPFEAVDHYLVRWELATGRQVFARRFPEGAARSDDRFDLGAHGNRLARLTAVDHPRGELDHGKAELQLWEVGSEGVLAQLWTVDARFAQMRDASPTDSVDPWTQLMFSPDGGLLVVIGETEVRVWKDLTATGATPLILRGIRGVPSALALSPDGRRLVMVTVPERDARGPGGVAELRVWDLTNSQELIVAPLPLRMAPSLKVNWSSFDGVRLRLVGGSPDQWVALVLDGAPR